MDILLDDDETRLRMIARDFFTKECPTSLVREMETDALGYPPDLWRKLAEMGWLGFALPPAFGDGAPLHHLGLLLEEIGRAAAPVPVLSTLVPALTLAEAGTEAQKRAVLPAVARGDRILTWAVAERHPHVTPESIRTVARRDGPDYVVDGAKLFVDDVPAASACLVLCRSAAAPDLTDWFVLLLVDTAAGGVTHTLLPTLAGDKQSEVRFTGVRVPATSLVGGEGQGWALAERMLERATALQCARIVGATRKAVEMTVDYAKWRTAFGKPIGAFQSIQHMCADMLTWVDGAQLLTYEALWKLGQGLPASLEVATAKAFCNDRCQAALRHANQIHAGIAQTLEFDLNLWFRRVGAWTMRLGTSFEHRRRIARALGLGEDGSDGAAAHRDQSRQTVATPRQAQGSA
jgi:alkylation response protein AidB-like acyl-CoA dehydrogenase